MNKQGMTMVEMIAVILIISVVTAIALPAVDNFRSSERCKAEASKLVDSIRQAKYLAMQDNTLIRIAFSPDGDAYKVQKISDDAYTTVCSYEGKIEESEKETNKYDNSYWESIADEEELDFDSSIEVDIGGLPNAIYFKPDGNIYYWSSSGVAQMPEQIVKFKYGNSAIAVEINYFGVISSETIPPEDDDYFESSGGSGGKIEFSGGKIGNTGGKIKGANGENLTVVVPTNSPK